MGSRFRRPATFDCCGWATRNDLECSDGRIIRHGAFDSNDGKKVPVVFNHEHKDIGQVLGHAILETRDEGVYSYISFNGSKAGRQAKASVEHGDLDELSIYANKLQQNGCNVLRGDIKELSLVIAGANPGAYIEDIALAHGDDVEETIVFTNSDVELRLLHADEDEEEYEDEYDEDSDEEYDEYSDEEYEEYSDEEYEEDPDEEYDDEYDEDSDEIDDEAIIEILENLSPEQQEAVAIATNIVAAKAAEDAIANLEFEGGNEMRHSVFSSGVADTEYLAHMAEFEAAVIEDASKPGIMSMRDSFLQHCELEGDEMMHGDYGIDNIDYLFPEYENINGDGAPGFINIRPHAWVDVVMNGVHHTPYAKVKMMFADITEDEARAKGYIKGNFKKEEVFKLLKRTVDATTIYKKQKFDRDDIIQITSFQVIAWVKAEMRLKLNEEIARCILFGDGRPTASEDKIDETKLIPIYNEADLYCIKKVVTPASGESLYEKFIDDALDAQDDYDGSGNITFFALQSVVNGMLKLKDKNGRRIYTSLADLALVLGVDKIVKVPATIVPDHVLGVMVDLQDYNVGADKGGAVNMFDDFDIDYNQMKYLIETKISGALTRPFSAICFKDQA